MVGKAKMRLAYVSNKAYTIPNTKVLHTLVRSTITKTFTNK